MRQLTFKASKAVEASLYIASRLTKPTIHEVLKMLYFADKFHLEEYGFLALGDKYYAMEFGPVAECTYDLLKIARGDVSSFHTDEMKTAVAGSMTVSPGNEVTPLRQARPEKLSASFVHAMDEAISRFGGLSFKERTDISHDAAWGAAWTTAIQRGQPRYEMPTSSIARTLDNADQVLEHLVGGRG